MIVTGTSAGYGQRGQEIAVTELDGEVKPGNIHHRIDGCFTFRPETEAGQGSEFRRDEELQPIPGPPGLQGIEIPDHPGKTKISSKTFLATSDDNRFLSPVALRRPSYRAHYPP